MKKLWNHIFVDGLNGMAFGFFCTYAIGTILQQLGVLLAKDLGDMFLTLGGVAIILTGAGIGIGMASKFQVPTTVALSAAVSGMVGAYAPNIYQSSVLGSDGVVKLSGPGDPLGAFIAALVAIEVGIILTGKTEFDLILTPSVSTGLGSVCGLLAAPLIDKVMEKLALLVQWGISQDKLAMGMVVSAIMCLLSLLPISTINLCIMLHLDGLAAGAATIGCCCSMIGFAVSSYRDNKFAGLFIQGIGTAKVQLPNILRRPLILLPSLLSSLVLGGISTYVFKLTNTAQGAGTGTTGLVGCLSTYEAMVESTGSSQALVIISLMCFVLPGVFALGISEGMRKMNLLKDGDMKIEI